MEELAKIHQRGLREIEKAIGTDPWTPRMEVATEQEAALNEVQGLFGKIAYTEDHLGFRLVGFYTNGYQCVQAIGATWEQAIEKLKEKAVSPRRIEQRGRWPWRSTLITR